MNLLGMTFRELVDEFGRRYGRGGYHAAPLYRAFYRCADFAPHRLPAFAQSPRFLGQIRRELDLSCLAVVRREAQDGVTKIGFRLADGLEIETVIIPMATHATVCISSQAGCRMGCRFCQNRPDGAAAQFNGRRNRCSGSHRAGAYGYRGAQCGTHGHGGAAGQF